MKKALVTILLTLVMSAGIIFPAASLVNADSGVNVISIGKTGSMGYFYLPADGYTGAIIEYSFVSNEILFSSLLEMDLTQNGSNTIGTAYRYEVTLPENALSYKVWRVIDGSDYIKSTIGANEFVISGYTISDVETRIKTVYITEDYITKEPVYSEVGLTYKFRMHFIVDDALGETIPIDHIHSLKAEFDVISSSLFGLLKTKNHVVKDIKATETRNATIWPYIYPATVINNIQESYYGRDDNIVGNEDYDWMVTIGTFTAPGLIGSNITVDQTTILSISYYYEGVFYEDIDVIDEPYDSEDIVPVIPGTTTVIDNGWGNLLEWVVANWQLVLKGLAVVAAVIIVGKVLSAIKVVMDILKLILKGGWLILKYFFLAIAYTFYFIFFMIPKGIGKALYWLFIPSDMRLRRKEQAYYDRRSI
ncbi:MAG: hypothetical protein KKE16_01160 [Firmicutes bacterium]|nr:hypothetical protein [Bacillota bacterium]